LIDVSLIIYIVVVYICQVIVVTLDVIGIVMLHVDAKTAKTHVHQVMVSLTSRMLDSNVMVRKAVMQLVMRLMQATSPVIVIDSMSETVRHKQPRVRQFAVDIVTAALLTHPRCEFDLAALCHMAVPTLVDQKKCVRQAAMECVAVIAQALGAGKLQPLMSSVDQLEDDVKYEGLMAAVQARLARRQLPSVSDDGLIEYAVLTPSATVRLSGVDIDWVKCGSCSVDPLVRPESLEVRTQSMSPTLRHQMSVKSLSKLPWENETSEVCIVLQ